MRERARERARERERESGRVRERGGRAMRASLSVVEIRTF